MNWGVAKDNVGRGSRGPMMKGNVDRVSVLSSIGLFKSNPGVCPDQETS